MSESMRCPLVLVRAAEGRALASSSVRVLVALQPFVAVDGFRPVSITRLSRVLAMDRHTVRDALRALVARGYLEPGLAVSQAEAASISAWLHEHNCRPLRLV